MKIFTYSSLAAILAASALSLEASAVKPNDKLTFNLDNYRYRVESKSVFHNKHALALAKAAGQAEDGTFQNPVPATSITGMSNMGSIDAPNGEIWYYTADLKYEIIPPHDNVMYEDRILQEYTYNIYDSQFKPIGTIKDQMEYRESEHRVVMCEITPVATRNFFNTTNDVEIIVGLSINAEEGYNHYRSLVYTLNGEKNTDGFDKPIMEFDNLVSDVVEGPLSNDGTDNFYITFMTENSLDDISDDSSFWEMLMSRKVDINIYGRATATSNGPRKIFTTDMRLLQAPGDQENIPCLISLNHNGQVYYCHSYYKEPFYNQYDDPITAELTQRENNSLVIDLYTANENGLTLYSTTEIPAPLDPMDVDGEPTALFSYYSVGSLRYRDDILFDAPGLVSGKPDYIITRGNYRISTDSTIDSYFTYNNNGQLKNTLALYAQSTIAMEDIKGFEPQQMFVTEDAFGALFKFVDLYSGATTTEIEQNYYWDDYSEPEPLMVNMARTPVGNSYQYVVELRFPTVDEQENDIMRFAWIKRDGQLDHFDRVNMGKNVMYAQSYLSKDALQPHAYSTSDETCYMMLIKRGVAGEANVEELLIAEKVTDKNPFGKDLLLIGPDENGILSGIYPEFGENACLQVYRYDTQKSLGSLSIYKLPLDSQAGVSDITNDADSAITVNGTTITANGTIQVYTTAGVLAATADGTIDIARLGAGLYVVVANGKAHKILVK